MSKIGFIVGHRAHTDQRTVEQRLLNDRGKRHHMCMTPGGCRCPLGRQAVRHPGRGRAVTIEFCPGAAPTERKPPRQAFRLGPWATTPQGEPTDDR